MASRLLLSIFVIMAAATILAVSAGGDGQSSPEKSQAMARHYLRCMRRKTHAFDWWPEKSFHDEIVDQGCRVSFMSIEGSYRTTGLLPDGYMEALQINHNYNRTAVDFHLCGLAFDRCPHDIKDRYTRLILAPIRRSRSASSRSRVKRSKTD